MTPEGPSVAAVDRQVHPRVASPARGCALRATRRLARFVSPEDHESKQPLWFQDWLLGFGS